jgi:enterochelin esterase-like enzyme
VARLILPSIALSVVFTVLIGLPSSAQAQWVTPRVTAPRLEYRTFNSAAAGTAVSFHIYTPPQYDSQPDRRFPVIYWLHGAGSATGGIAPMTNWFATAMAQGVLSPVIIVFPNGMPYGMYCDAANGTRPMETVIVHELIPHVDATYCTIASREGRVLEGFSMGGYGSGRFGFTYSDRFTAISMLGAGPVQTDFMNAPDGTNFPPALRAAIFADVWNSDPQIFYARSPWALAEVHRDAIVGGGLRIRMAVGQSDAMLATNTDLHNRLLQLNIAHSWQTYPGVGHDPLALLRAIGDANWAFYREVLPRDCDFNADGTRDFFDYLDFVAAFDAENLSADFNRDGAVDFFDYLDFVAAFDAGC